MHGQDRIPRAAHSGRKDKDQADQIIKKLKGGAKFEDLAKAKSIDTGSKIKGGDLGWFTTSRMVKPFADAVKGLKKGETTPEPVQTQFGWHIIQLEDTRDATAAAVRSGQGSRSRIASWKEVAGLRRRIEEDRQDRKEAR